MTSKLKYYHQELILRTHPHQSFSVVSSLQIFQPMCVCVCVCVCVIYILIFHVMNALTEVVIMLKALVHVYISVF
jgi:hypothetical protein